MFYEFNHFGISEYFHKEYGENFSYPLHLHQSFEFITILSGTMEITVNNTAYTLKEGQSLLLFPNQLHSLSSEHSRHMLCIFSPELIKAYSSKIKDKLPESNLFQPDVYLINQLDNICDNASSIEKKGLLYSLCAEFDKNAIYTSNSYPDRDLLSKIFEFVEHSYNGDCSLFQLSEKMGYSYSYLSRYFKKIVGMSFNDYVNRYRISNACYMLSNTDITVIRCAMDNGFGTLRSFNRNFIRLVGVSPKEYRKSARNTLTKK